MRIFTILFLFINTLGNTQLLKVVDKGLILVKDSLSELQIGDMTFELYDNNYVGNLKINSKPREKIGSYIIPKLINDSMIVIKKDGFWGCINLMGNIVLPFKYIDYPTFFKNATYVGAYYEYGNSVTDERFVRYVIRDFKENDLVQYNSLVLNYKDLFLMSGNDMYDAKFGLINSNLDTILPFDFKCTSWDDKNFHFSEKGFLALENSEKKCGVINDRGETVVDFNYEYIQDVVFDLNKIVEKSKQGLLDSDMKLVLPVEYDYIYFTYEFTTELAALTFKNGIWEVWDTNFNKYCKETFEFIEGFDLDHPTTAIVRKDGKYGLFDFKQKVFRIECIYDTIFKMEQDYDSIVKYLFTLKTANKYLFLDENYKIKSEIEGENLIQVNKSDLLILTKSQKKYLINRNGKILSKAYDELIYDDAGKNGLFHDYFIIKTNDQYGWIKSSGEIFINPEFDTYCPFIFNYNSEGNHNYYFTLAKGKKVSNFDKLGKLISVSSKKNKVSLCNRLDE